LWEVLEDVSKMPDSASLKNCHMTMMSCWTSQYLPVN
jgi:hypothetical protein